ncbi:MAG: alpha/beta hydrolase [Chitinophagaceae bacterium]
MNILLSSFPRFIITGFCILSAVFTMAQDNSFVVPLWANGAPGFENRKNEPEQAKDWWVKNIHNPSLTVFPAPKDKATGAAVVICPGGGHRELVFNPEGRDAAVFFNSIGVTALVLKYRLYREENSPYKKENAMQDAVRAMRLAHSRAAEWNIDTARLGMMGFSAGGEVVAWVAYDEGKGNTTSNDPVERFSSRPSFQILIYPGPDGIPDSIRPTAPPAFLLAANDDACCSGPVVEILTKYRKANVPIEVHLYAQGSHGFNMGNRSKLNSLYTWPQRLGDWMKDNGWLNRK